MREQIKGILDDFRFAVAYVLLSWAMSVVPKNPHTISLVSYLLGWLKESI